MAQYTEKSGKVVFKEYDQRQIQLLPPSLEELIPDHHLVRVINSVVDGLEFRNLERVYRGGGTSSYHNGFFRFLNQIFLLFVSFKLQLNDMANNILATIYKTSSPRRPRIYR